MSILTFSKVDFTKNIGLILKIAAFLECLGNQNCFCSLRTQICAEIMQIICRKMECERRPKSTSPTDSVDIS